MGQYEILKHLKTNKGRMFTVEHIADKFNHSVTATNECIRKLFKANLIKQNNIRLYKYGKPTHFYQIWLKAPYKPYKILLF